jgi:hypothetical protein
MQLNEFVNKTVDEMLSARMDGESFRTVIETAIKLTVKQCADRVQYYSDCRVPASTYSELLKKEFK